jgi:hypothetical protein
MICARAPDFIKGNLSFKVADFVAFLENHQNGAGYVNVVIKDSKSGKTYFELDTWEPTQRQAPIPPPEEITPSDLPF